MKNFNYLSDYELQSIFYKPPLPFDRHSDISTLAYALGATLYMPATRPDIASDILNQKHKGLASVVLCLEDSIGDNQVQEAEQSLIKQLKYVKSFEKSGRIKSTMLPLIFVRVREPEQMVRLIEQLGESVLILTGFIFPKFTTAHGENYFEILAKYNRYLPGKLYGMPILETADVIFKETRVPSLLAIRSVLDKYREYVLNVRMGGTDFSSLFGLRRGADVTIYDIITIRDCISDIINIFGRAGSEYVISGPVWEYFKNGNRLLKPQLRESMFERTYGPMGTKLRQDIVNNFEDALLKEVMLDKENGLIGKTIIHPSHIKPVQALYVVSHEEYMDASSIIDNNNGNQGVVRSNYANKMNEIKPHLNWARKIFIRSQIYGVYHEGHNFTNLLAEPVYV